MFGAIALANLIVFSEKDYHIFGPYAEGVPTPKSVLGYAVGSRHSDLPQQERVVNAIAASSPERIVRMDYGKSTEGRSLRVFAISSPKNITNLSKIRADIAMVSQTPHDASVKDVVKNSPAIVWVNQCIHGDETASFESSMELMYNLVASRDPNVMAALENVVVILNPAYNPDGHDRYVTAYNSIPNGNPERGSYDRSLPSAFFGRANHYRFDMNRDRVAMSQAETRQEVRMFLQWNPQVYVDQHGQVETYFFPPVQESVNPNVDRARYAKWTEIFGRATGNAFDQRGWTYYIRDQFDFYNVCYLDSHATLMGAIGMTHETDGGRVMAERRSDDTILTLADGVEKHLTSAMAVITSAASKREELLSSYQEFKSSAVSGKHGGNMQRVVVMSDEPRELHRLATLLGRSNIESRFAAKEWTQGRSHNYWTGKEEKVKFPAGSLVIDLAQPQGPLAKSLLEPITEFEPEFVKRQLELAKNREKSRPDPELDSYEFYDSTAWSLPYSFNLQAYWCEAAPAISAKSGAVTNVRTGSSSVGYFLRYRDQADILLVDRLLRQGVKVSLVTREIKTGGETLAPGTFLFLKARNTEGLEEKLGSDRTALRPLSTSYPDSGRAGPGSGSVYQLVKPRVGIVFGDAGRLLGGPTWYLMEQEFKLPYEGLAASALNQNLSHFTAIVVPEGAANEMTPKLRDFVAGGGTLVCLGDPRWVTSEKGVGKVETKEASESLPGSFFQASLDPYHWLSYGYPRDGYNPIPVSVPVEGDILYKTPEGGGVIDFSADAKVKKTLSGWTWPSTEKDLSGTSWLLTKSIGRGTVVMFSQDPNWRAQYPGLWKLYLNSIILGSMR